LKRNSEISKRYAKALIELCGETKNLENVEKDILNLDNLINNNNEIKEILKSQIVSRDNLAKIMENVLKKLNSNSLTVKFVGTIAVNGRLQNLKNIVDEFLKMMSDKRGELVADVITAFPISKDINNSLVKEVKKLTKSEKIELKTTVDKSLIGGFVLRVGSTMIDSSIKTKLNSLKMIMKGV
jgi:F-type H+-transporting ATPase subunit delta